MLSVSRSSADNASVHTHALSSAACCEPGGDSRGKDEASSQACAKGARCSRNPSSCSEVSQERAETSGSRAPASVHACVRALQGTRPPRAQAEGQAGELHQTSITSEPPEILYPPG